MNNKKKYIIAIVAFIVCSIMFALALKVQQSYANKVLKEQSCEVAAESKPTSKDEVKGNSVGKTSAQTKNEEKKDDNKKENTENKTVKSNDTINNSNTSTNQNTAGKAISQSNTPPNEEVQSNEEPTFIFIDAVNKNRVILQKHVDIEGETIGYITCKLLDEAKIKYRTTGSSSTIYFADIDGLEEKKAGRLSGWCYYVKKKGDSKFQKPNIGSGQLKYEKGDIVAWKYLEDGIHDGYSK